MNSNFTHSVLYWKALYPSRGIIPETYNRKLVRHMHISTTISQHEAWYWKYWYTGISWSQKTRMIKYVLNICWKYSEVHHLLHLNIRPIAVPQIPWLAYIAASINLGQDITMYTGKEFSRYRNTQFLHHSSIYNSNVLPLYKTQQPETTRISISKSQFSEGQDSWCFDKILVKC